jgi:copper oxidase (laccase) domain-containing protein
MIQTDQPTIFDSTIVVGLSSVDDGTMKSPVESEQSKVRSNRQKFMKQLAIFPKQTHVIDIVYDKQDFAVYSEVGIDEADAVKDALVTRELGVAIFLPLGDCVGAILYDAVQKILMVSHLGRHNIEQDGGAKSVQFLIDSYGSNPADIVVWLSPSPSKEVYPLWAFDNKGLDEVVCEQLQSAGILPENIESQSIDTASNDNYYSHSEALKGRKEKDGRHAIVAMMA